MILVRLSSWILSSCSFRVALCLVSALISTRECCANQSKVEVAWLYRLRQQSSSQAAWAAGARDKPFLYTVIPSSHLPQSLSSLQSTIVRCGIHLERFPTMPSTLDQADMMVYAARMDVAHTAPEYDRTAETAQVSRQLSHINAR